MLRKKLLALLTAGVLVFAIGGTPVFAAARPESVRNPLCTVESCTQTVNHRHDGKLYAGHTVNDGHNYHPNCPITDCTQLGEHQHPNCPVADCTQLGEHQHPNCPVADCTQLCEHKHTNCGVVDCNLSGTHQHNANHRGGGHGRGRRAASGHHR